MKLNIHDVARSVKFFGVHFNDSDKYHPVIVPVIVSIDKYGTTEVTFCEELTENLS